MDINVLLSRWDELGGIGSENLADTRILLGVVNSVYDHLLSILHSLSLHYSTLWYVYWGFRYLGSELTGTWSVWVILITWFSSGCSVYSDLPCMWFTPFGVWEAMNQVGRLPVGGELNKVLFKVLNVSKDKGKRKNTIDSMIIFILIILRSKICYMHI